MDDAKRYVAFADVLGFSSIAKSNPHDRLLNLYGGTLKLAVDYAASGGRTVVDPADGLPSFDVATCTVNMRIISDSVVVWTDDDNAAEFVALVLVVTNLLKAAMFNGIPMRAALSWGDLAYLQMSYGSPRLGVQSLVGRALVEATDAEKIQRWSGGYVLPSALARYVETRGPAAPSPEHLQEVGWLRNYAIPLRDGPVDALAFNWTRPPPQGLTPGSIRQCFEDWEKGPAPADKVENTIKFAQDVGAM